MVTPTRRSSHQELNRQGMFDPKKVQPLPLDDSDRFATHRVCRWGGLGTVFTFQDEALGKQKSILKPDG